MTGSALSGRPRGRLPRYRAYSAGDVERLREVLAYRRLGLGLREIADLVDDPATDAVAHLHRLRGLLLEQRDRADAMVTAIDRELTARAKGMAVTPDGTAGNIRRSGYMTPSGGRTPRTRRTDPRIAAQVWDALSDCALPSGHGHDHSCERTRGR